MENKPPEKKENEDAPLLVEDGSTEYGPLPDWAKELAKKTHPRADMENENYRIDHIEIEDEKNKKNKEDNIFLPGHHNDPHFKPLHLSLLPIEKPGGMEDHVGENFFKPKPDVWENDRGVTPLKKMENAKPKDLKKPLLKKNYPTEETAHFELAEKGSLVKTEDDAKKIAEIKEKAAAEKRRKEQEQKRKEGIYSKLRSLFQKPKSEK